MADEAIKQGFAALTAKMQEEGTLTREGSSNSLRSLKDALMGVETSNKEGVKETRKASDAQLAALEKARAARGKPTAADKETEQKNTARQSRLLAMIGNLGKGVRDLAQSGASKAGDAISGAFKGIFGFIKRFKKLFLVGGLLLLLPVLEKFFNSPAFESMKKTFNDKILPALIKLKDFFMNTMLPFFEDIALILFNALGGVFDAIGTLIDDLFGEDADTSFIGIFKSINKYVLSILDTVGTAIFNIIARIFGMEGTESIGAAIGNFFTSIYDSVVNFFTVTIPAAVDQAISFLTQIKDKIVGIFTGLWTEVQNLFGDFAVFQFVQDTFGQLFSSIKAIFSGDFSLENFTALFGSLMDIVYMPLNLIVNTVKDMFSIGDPNEPFSLSDFIFGPDGIVTKVFNFFKDLFNIDFKALLGDLLGKLGKIGSKIAGFFGLGGGGDAGSPAVGQGMAEDDIEGAEGARMKPAVDRAAQKEAAEDMVEEMMTGRGEGQVAMAKEFDAAKKVRDRQARIAKVEEEISDKSLGARIAKFFGFGPDTAALAKDRSAEAAFQSALMGGAEGVGFREKKAMTQREKDADDELRRELGLRPRSGAAQMRQVRMGTAEQQIRAQEMKRARENEAAARESMMEESMTGTGVINNAPTTNNSSSKQTTITSTQLAPQDQNTRAAMKAAIY